VEALSIYANVIGARVVVIESAKQLIDAVTQRIAEIGGAGIAVIAIFLRVDTDSIYADVTGTGVAVIAFWGKLTRASDTEIVGTRVGVSANHGRAAANSLLADIVSARVVISAVCCRQTFHDGNNPGIGKERDGGEC